MPLDQFNNCSALFYHSGTFCKTSTHVPAYTNLSIGDPRPGVCCRQTSEPRNSNEVLCSDLFSPTTEGTPPRGRRVGVQSIVDTNSRHSRVQHARRTEHEASRSKRTDPADHGWTNHSSGRRSLLGSRSFVQYSSWRRWRRGPAKASPV